MAATIGKDGIICIDGTTVNPAYIDSWTLNSEIGTAEITAFQDDARQYLGTLRSHTVTGTGTLDRSDAKQAALLACFESSGSSTALEIRMYLDSSSTSFFRSYGIPTGMTVNSAVGDKVSINFTFQGTSDVAYS